MVLAQAVPRILVRSHFTPLTLKFKTQSFKPERPHPHPNLHSYTYLSPYLHFGPYPDLYRDSYSVLQLTRTVTLTLAVRICGK